MKKVYRWAFLSDFLSEFGIFYFLFFFTKLRQQTLGLLLLIEESSIFHCRTCQSLLQPPSLRQEEFSQQRITSIAAGG